MSYSNANVADIGIGEQAENDFVNHMKKLGLFVSPYRDLQSQARLGDFKVGFSQDMEPAVSYEVKGRLGHYDDILLETWSNKQKGQRGWLYELDENTMLFYVFLYRREAAIGQIGALRKFVYQHGDTVKTMRPKQKLDRQTEFVCVPIDTLVCEGLISIHTLL